MQATTFFRHRGVLRAVSHRGTTPPPLLPYGRQPSPHHLYPKPRPYSRPTCPPTQGRPPGVQVQDHAPHRTRSAPFFFPHPPTCHPSVGAIPPSSSPKGASQPARKGSQQGLWPNASA
ncbi:hypothetical protein BS50DRAFT_280712 [Corynespora cassiicola Philippines]|uniref:Uncharacterized protein n=1 Tax=Corynespora cassiicola Philippines TaxID=1448308 RepID=A0A2T2P104_CORCC|nr:hypothetical protein BS50DRAFT_280712 [Corynespora cassiicola Philippines]